MSDVLVQVSPMSRPTATESVLRRSPLRITGRPIVRGSALSGEFGSRQWRPGANGRAQVFLASWAVKLDVFFQPVFSEDGLFVWYPASPMGGEG